MGSIEVAAEEDADGFVAFRGQIAEESNEADLVLDFEIWSGSHWTRRCWLESLLDA